jgi:hypothetical protein
MCLCVVTPGCPAGTVMFTEFRVHVLQILEFRDPKTGNWLHVTSPHAHFLFSSFFPEEGSYMFFRNVV